MGTVRPQVGKSPRRPTVEAVVPSRLGRGRIDGTHGIAEEHPMDKKAKTPKKPKQTKTKDGAAKGK
jgi:hypothetical protein